MKSSISLVVITKNAEKFLDKTLSSVNKLVDEIILVDDYSTDSTIRIAKKYGAQIFFHHEKDLGTRRAFALKKAQSEWILILDADEMISPALKKEINYVLTSKVYNLKSNFRGYWIPFQTYFLGRPLHYGGENYKKLIFFKKDSVRIKPAFVHEKYELIRGKAGVLKNKVEHYSYESISNMYKKFTDYAIRDAEQKMKQGETSSIKKIIKYPIHMFWARFIKDKGYKDGIFRLPLDIGFAYMELLTYLLLWFYSWRISKIKYPLQGKQISK